MQHIFSLRYKMLYTQLVILFGLLGFGQGIWRCQKPRFGQDTTVSTTSTTTTTTPEPKVPRKGYNCDEGEKVTLSLGMFLNKATETVERPLPEANYGVEALKPHELDYEELKNARELWWDPKSVPWAFDPKNMTTEIKIVSIEPGKMVRVYQRARICTYFNEFTSETVEGAVKVFSEPGTIASGLEWGDCRDSITWTPWDIDTRQWPDYHDVSEKGNLGNKPWEVLGMYKEGVEDTEALGVDMNAGRLEMTHDDTAQLLNHVNDALSRIPSPSPVTGLAAGIWSNFKLTSLGLTKKNFTLVVPVKKRGNWFQVKAQCGPMKVSGPTFIVYRAADGVTAGPCETPHLDPCVMIEGEHKSITFLGTPDMLLAKDLYLDSCKDDLHEVQTPKDATKVDVKYGLAGPRSDKIGDGFKQVFSDGMHEITKRDRNMYFLTPKTGFTWTSYDITDWSPYGNVNKAFTVPPRKVGADSRLFVLQIVVNCGRYTYYTQEVLFVDYAHGENWKCISIREGGLTLDCDPVRAWVGQAAGVFLLDLISCNCLS